MLDVCPDSFKHLPGWKEAVEERAKVGALPSFSTAAAHHACPAQQHVSTKAARLVRSWRARPRGKTSLLLLQVREALMARPPGEFLTMGKRIYSEPGHIGGVHP